MAPGVLQIAVVILLVVVLFGAGRIPTIMENLAKGINSFKKGLKDEDITSDSSKKSKSDTDNGEDA
ncbi:MAG: twin-arginine translocase TatA/TatE family subunit [Alphaproteobacteria bacterium]|nr:MAG: twin-arginine translocase TatA/TatE family subunit [Alphaproteobacteria bacterium]